MMIPVAHENLRGRRWPWVTIAIIALNFVIFLATNGRIEKELHDAGRVQLHILLLSARYPDAQMTPDVSQMVGAFKREHAEIYKQLASPRRPVDEWDSQLQSGKPTDTDINAEMAGLCSNIEQFHNDSLAWNYAFHPYRPTLRSYVTASFLHGGWLHIIFNMWFLWLAGTVLEDAWGRVVYPIFYLVSGVFAFLVHAAVFPDSFVPVVGASGAIAGLMGGFLARFSGFWEFYDPQGERHANSQGLPYRPGDNLTDTRFIVQPTKNLDSPTMKALLAEDAGMVRDVFWSDGMVRATGREYNGLIDSPCFKNATDDARTLSCYSCHAMHKQAADSRLTAQWADGQLAAGMENQA